MACFGGNDVSIRMEGGKPLGGRIWIQGSKNAALPILAACMLIPGKCLLRGCPDITDIGCMCNLLKSTGAAVNAAGVRGASIGIDTRSVREHRLPEKYVSAMRSSVIMMGAMLGRLGEVCVNYPGGCVIGERPIDLHLHGLEKLGAQIWIEGNHIHAYADELKGAVIDFPFPSVGATQNVILAAVTAQGTTVIKNAAREPEIIELCKFLNKAGARIDYSGTLLKTGRIIIQGVELSRLHGVEYDIIPDRIVAGTYLFAALAAGGAGYYFKIYKPKKDLDDAEDFDELTGGDEEETVNEDEDGDAQEETRQTAYEEPAGYEEPTAYGEPEEPDYPETYSGEDD